MSKTAWEHLPNAEHIDRILANSNAQYGAWTAAWGAARGAAWGAARGAARAAAWEAARAAARAAAWGAARAAARAAAWGASQALIAWDDCAHILDMHPDAVKTLAAIGHEPSILLLPAVIALQHKEELCTQQNKT